MAKRWSWMTIIFIGVMQLIPSRITPRSKDGNGCILPITEHKSANLGDEVILHDPVPNANNKSITWLFNNCRIVQKQPGQEPFVHNKNYQLMDNGDLKILNMTKQLEGEYERLVGHDSTIYVVKAKAVIVTDVSSTYKEKIIDAVIHKEWNIIFHLSTGNCEAKIDKITLCFKKPDDHQCTNLANARCIVSKPGACEATIMFNQTSRNIGLKYYVKFPPIDSSDFKEENGDEVNSQTFLLTQAPSTEENTTHPITNPPPKSNTVSTITLNLGQKNTEQSLKATKPTNTLSMTSSVENKHTHQPSTVNTNNQPTDRKSKESCEQTNGEVTPSYPTQGITTPQTTNSTMTPTSMKRNTSEMTASVPSTSSAKDTPTNSVMTPTSTKRSRSDMTASVPPVILPKNTPSGLTTYWIIMIFSIIVLILVIIIISLLYFIWTRRHRQSYDNGENH